MWDFFHRTVRSCLENLSAESDRLLCTLIFRRLHKGPCIVFSLFCGWCVLLLVFSFDLVWTNGFQTTHSFGYALSLWTSRTAKKSFSWPKIVFRKIILQPNFSLDSIFDPVVGSDEPAPRNSWVDQHLIEHLTWLAIRTIRQRAQTMPLSLKTMSNIVLECLWN